MKSVGFIQVNNRIFSLVLNQRTGTMKWYSGSTSIFPDGFKNIEKALRFAMMQGWIDDASAFIAN